MMLPTLELLRAIEVPRGGWTWRSSTPAGTGAGGWHARRWTALGGYPVLESKVRALARYEESFGTLPAYLDEYAAVWKEIQG